MAEKLALDSSGWVRSLGQKGQNTRKTSIITKVRDLDTFLSFISIYLFVEIWSFLLCLTGKPSVQDPLASVSKVLGGLAGVTTSSSRSSFCILLVLKTSPAWGHQSPFNSDRRYNHYYPFTQRSMRTEGPGPKIWRCGSVLRALIWVLGEQSSLMTWVPSELNINCLQVAFVVWWRWGRGTSSDLTPYGKPLPFQMQIVIVCESLIPSCTVSLSHSCFRVTEAESQVALSLAGPWIHSGLLCINFSVSVTLREALCCYLIALGLANLSKIQILLFLSWSPLSLHLPNIFFLADFKSLHKRFSW